MHTPTDHQLSEFAKASRGNVGLLVGPPGTGKTTVAGCHIREQLAAGRSVVAGALSAAAARRLTIKMKEAKINLEATTIHKMLGYTYVDGYGCFTYGHGNPLSVDLIVIDEGSMPAIDLYASVFAARRKDARILILGDIEQLSPIGHGAPLRDMIGMYLPHGHLTEIHRNAGRVVKCCKLIAEQQRFESSKEIDILPPGSDHDDENLWVDEEWKTPEEQTKVIEDWLSPTSRFFDVDGAACSGRDVADPIWDLQVICPMRQKKSPLSTASLNPKIQSWLNGAGHQVKGNKFREADKVMCVENGWYSAAPGCPQDVKNADGRVYVANGNQGKVLEVEPRYTIVQFDLPDRIARFGKTAAKTASDADESAGRLELAYAITVHKYQGSQAPGIIFVGDESAGANWIADRHLVLTAISRMERLCVCVAKKETLSGWCRKSHLKQRKTFLAEKYFSLMVAK